VVKTANSKKKKAVSPESDHRRYPRLKPSAVPSLKSVSFNQGGEVQVIDISRGGMLLETEVRLRPQMKIHLKLLTIDGLIKLDGSVLRSSITSLKGAPRYQSAIAFDHPFHMLDDLSQDTAAASEAQPESAAALVPEQGSDLPLPNPVLDQYDDNSAVMTFVAVDMPSSVLIDMFKQNDW
jgi:hypothetical protein